MHLYMRSVGFADMSCSEAKMEKFIKEIIKNACELDAVMYDPKKRCAVIKYNLGKGFGIEIKGSFYGKNKFRAEYFYPFIDSNASAECKGITVERHADKDSYAVVCDELKIGATMIFYMENVLDLYKCSAYEGKVVMTNRMTVSAFCREGQILLPLMKSNSQINKEKKDALVRKKLIMAARMGDEKAMENLAISEMDMYSKVCERVRYEDLYTVVDTTLMPCGVECDQYAVIGTIISCELNENLITSEKVWIIKLECNDVVFDMAINDKDLVGEPMVGRRFKGRVWMCAHVEFERIS